jgi:hypothetical protein
VTRTIGQVHVCIVVDELGLGLDWTRRSCVRPGEVEEEAGRRAAKPSDHLCCTHARRLLLEDVRLHYLPRDWGEGRIDAPTF